MTGADVTRRKARRVRTETPSNQHATLSHRCSAPRQTSRRWLIMTMVIIAPVSAACGLDWAVVEAQGNNQYSPDASDGQMGAGDGGLSGDPCSIARPCAGDQYCDYPDQQCGQGAQGICRPRPVECNEAGPSQCGCDGKRYTMSCEAHRAGTDDGPDACATDSPEYFACGSSQCRVGSQFCSVSGLLGAYTYTCKDAGSCTTSDCMCKSEPCLGGQSCIPVTGGGTTHVCTL